jgi:hypothetical protein
MLHANFSFRSKDQDAMSPEFAMNEVIKWAKTVKWVI